MDIIFSKILSMSLSASFVIAAVLLLRLVLRKAPKKYSYFLWFLVFFRLLCPFTLESALSLIPVKEDAIVYQSSTGGSSMKVNTGMETVDLIATTGIDRLAQSVTQGNSVGSQTDMEQIKISFLNKFFLAMLILWIIGVFVLAVVGIVQVLKLRRKLRTAILVSAGTKDCCAVYESEYIHTAFLLGIFRPRIYLPLGIREERSYVIAHEMMHKKRRDYLVKPICYLAVILHWFNPLVWVSFHLMTKDMEMSCDEQVLKSAVEDIRGAYSKSLLNLSIKGSSLAIPLAFGETNTKTRIKHALKYKKPSTWIGIGAIIVLLIAAITLLTTNPGETESGKNNSGDKSSYADLQNDEEAKEELYRKLSENRNLYIGDISADGKLIQLLPGLNCYKSKGMELQTTNEPYELKINYKKTELISYREERENIDTMWNNAIFLFATIENMDICTFSLDDGEEVSETRYTREDMEEIFGALYQKSETPDGLRELEQQMADYQKKIESTLSSLYTESEQEQQNIMTAIDNIISKAILDYTQKDYPSEGENVEAHVILGGETYIFGQLIRSDQEMVFYILARHAKYGRITGDLVGDEILVNAAGEVTENTVKIIEENDLGGCSFPAKVTISIGEDGTYALKEFWVPRDGAGLDDDIKAEFPEEFWNAALSWEGYTEQLEKALMQKAVKQLFVG